MFVCMIWVQSDQSVKHFLFLLYIPMSSTSLSHELSPLQLGIPRRMTAVCPFESSPDRAEAGACTAGSRGSGAAGTAGGSSVSAAAGTGESTGDSVGGSVGGTAGINGGQKYTRWSRQDSSDINTDDEGTVIRRLTPLEKLSLDMCQDDR